MFSVLSSLRKYGCVLCIVFCAVMMSGNSASSSVSEQSTKWENNEEIAIFREYLRIPTVHPNVDYKPAVDFLKTQAIKASLPVNIHYPVNKDNPVVVMTWEGSQPELPTIMLNSHIDVVPVYEEYWKHPPFAAEMEENGDIYARGAQDTKGAGVQYLAAIRSLKQQGINQLKRTVHVVFVPDEEIGGDNGMTGFVQMDEFKAMNVGFVLDEGGPPVHDNEVLPAYYAERTLWHVEFIFHGQSGHGSMLFSNTPGEKLSYVVGKLMEYRKEEMRKFTELKYPYGNVTSINLTMIKGGMQRNVIPAEMSATFDMRVTTHVDIDAFEQQIKDWCEEAGGSITIRTLERSIKEIPTRTDDSNPYWVAFKNGVNEAGLDVEPEVLGPSSDKTVIRSLNISAIGFAPMVNTETRAHDHNEYLNAETFLEGIKVYEKIITNLGNLDDF